DFNFSTDATFGVNVSNGTYFVTLTMGDAAFAHDQMGIFLEGTQVDSVSTAAGQFLTSTYSVTVSDGQLTLRLKDLGGSDPNVVLNALSIVPASMVQKFDFGTASSPVAAGYTQVTESTTYSASQGYGWLSGAVGLSSRDRMTADPLT